MLPDWGEMSTDNASTDNASIDSVNTKVSAPPVAGLLTPHRVVMAAVIAAGLQIVATLVALWAERSGNDAALVATSAVHMFLFTVGTIGLFTGFVKGLGRSRTSEISVGGLFFIAGDAGPAHDRKVMRLALGVQVLTAIVGASLAPLTAVAFTCLAPAAGFGCFAIYGAFLGAFPEREIDSRLGV